MTSFHLARLGWWLQIRDKLKQLKLNDADVWKREERRKKEQGDVVAPWYIKAPFWLLCVMLDACFANRCVLLGASCCLRGRQTTSYATCCVPARAASRPRVRQLVH